MLDNQVAALTTAPIIDAPKLAVFTRHWRGAPKGFATVPLEGAAAQCRFEQTNSSRRFQQFFSPSRCRSQRLNLWVCHYGEPNAKENQRHARIYTHRRLKVRQAAERVPQPMDAEEHIAHG